MALTSTISNTILDPNGVAQAGVLVVVTLQPTGGFRVDDATEVARVVSATTNASGVWSLALERNSNITPSSTYYQVDEQIAQSAGGPRSWNIQVGASNQTVSAALVTPLPAAQASGFLTQASADARYQALGSLGAGTPAASAVGDAGTAGVSVSASHSDHKHPREAFGTPVSVGTANAAGSAATVAHSDHVHTGAALGTLPGGYKEITTPQSGVTTPVDITGLTVTVTPGSGRRIRITASCAMGGTVATDVLRVSIKEGATVLQIRDVVPGAVSATTGNINLEFSVVLTPTNAAHTYRLTVERAAGTGTVQVNGNATFPSFILVEDIGV